MSHPIIWGWRRGLDQVVKSLIPFPLIYILGMTGKSNDWRNITWNMEKNLVEKKLWHFRRLFMYQSDVSFL